MTTQVLKPPSTVTVDSNGFVRVEGVCLGKLTADGQAIQVIDKDRRRSLERGSRYVVVPLTELSNLADKK